jgi:alginate O-acetyltransferase complex protein AlgI
LALFASILFYAWGAPKLIIIVLISIFIDYYLVNVLHKSDGKKKKWLLLASVVLNIGLLAYFKYANFFIDNVNAILTQAGYTSISWTKIALPIGISFYTFQKMSYAVDVYRKVKEPLAKISDYALFILLFPQLIAGPIVRFNEVADQLVDRKANENTEFRLMGFYRFIIGLSKKVLIANVMGAKADEIMGMDFASIDATLAWTGILAYTFQIYFDFSGYSDMAIGLGKMMGFKFPENFNNPYISRNISEFWRRWHITLGTWMRDYLYIPLGGNRVKFKMRLYLNLWFVFLISGLWHGASWNFVVWGGYHGLFLILDRLFLIKLLDKLGKIPSVIFTFFVTVIGWVLFRIEDFGQIRTFLKKMFSFDFSSFAWHDNAHFVVIFILAVLFSFFTFFKPGYKFEQKFFFSNYNNSTHIIVSFICVILLVFSISFVTSTGFNPFIYFRF